MKLMPVIYCKNRHLSLLLVAALVFIVVGALLVVVVAVIVVVVVLVAEVFVRATRVIVKGEV